MKDYHFNITDVELDLSTGETLVRVTLKGDQYPNPSDPYAGGQNGSNVSFSLGSESGTTDSTPFEFDGDLLGDQHQVSFTNYPEDSDGAEPKALLGSKYFAISGDDPEYLELELVGAEPTESLGGSGDAKKVGGKYKKRPGAANKSIVCSNPTITELSYNGNMIPCLLSEVEVSNQGNDNLEVSCDVDFSDYPDGIFMAVKYSNLDGTPIVGIGIIGIFNS